MSNQIPRRFDSPLGGRRLARAIRTAEARVAMAAASGLDEEAVREEARANALHSTMCDWRRRYTRMVARAYESTRWVVSVSRRGPRPSCRARPRRRRPSTRRCSRSSGDPEPPGPSPLTSRSQLIPRDEYRPRRDGTSAFASSEAAIESKAARSMEGCVRSSDASNPIDKELRCRNLGASDAFAWRARRSARGCRTSAPLSDATIPTKDVGRRALNERGRSTRSHVCNEQL